MLSINESRCNPANMITLSIRHDRDDYSSYMRITAACKRFLRSASLLPDEGFLGWQIDTRTFSNVAFSSSGVKVTMEDFDWIFDQCAASSPLTSEWMEDLYAEGRKVYMLTSVAGSTRDVEISEHRTDYIYDDDRDEPVSRDLIYDTFERLTEMGAVIRITAGSTAEKTKGHGRIFISFPDEITLRMQGMLSFAFPHIVADEVDKLPEEADEMKCLPDDCFLESMTKILSVLVYRDDSKEPTDEFIDGLTDGAADEFTDEPTDKITGESADEIKPNDTDFIIPEDETIIEDDLEFDIDDEEFEVFTPIDDLELSIRSYNCLKRAGINTVEELKRLSDEDLTRVRNLGRKSIEEIKKKIAEIQGLSKAVPLRTDNYMARLDGLIGLTCVKEQIRKIAAFAQMKQDMLKNGNANISVSLNMEFVGNPGTAKTTVARIVAGVFYELGLLTSSELIEVGRADLVAEYIGQTAIKVKNVFRKAKGKMLFIDEAYSLVDDRKGSFGDEAINTIIQEMENNREETIVVFAGYPDKMESFFSRNPGLRSRVPFSIGFSDYSANEMVKIAELEAKKRGFSVDTEAYEKVTAICSDAALYPDGGNGRFCRNLIENAILGYASRVYGNNDSDADKNYILAAEDFTPPTGMNDTKKMPIGFHAGHSA